jgi:hypothetical protein
MCCSFPVSFLIFVFHDTFYLCIHLNNFLFLFRESLLDTDRGYKGERVEGLDFFVEHLSWKKLPKEVFEVYGGFDAAKVLREELGFNQKPENLKDLINQQEIMNAALEAEAAMAGNEAKPKAEMTATDKIQEKVNQEELRQKREKERITKKALAMGLDPEKALAVKSTDSMSHSDELKKRFMAAAVGVETHKKRKLEAGIIDEWATEKEENEPIPFVIPSVSWTLLDQK